MYVLGPRLVKVFSNEKHRGVCKHCGAPLLWTRTVHRSRPMPFNKGVTPEKTGVDERSGEPVEFYRVEACHWETCRD